MARKKEEEPITEDNTTEKTEVKSKPTKTSKAQKTQPTPKKEEEEVVVKKTLLECIDELEDSTLIFEKLVKHNLYQQYKEERELRKQDRFIPPTINVDEFKRLMED